VRAGVVARGDETTVSFSSSRWIESADRCPRARLEDGVIHVWGFTLDESYDSVETARQWLDTVELTRASGLSNLAPSRLLIGLASEG